MASWQGPALYVFNNATFSAQDYHNLSQIGQGSKRDKLSATGRFGLGFNAVYHFSDVPSFVSGDFLVLFDPHCAFLPGTNARQPGLKIRFTQPNSNILAHFPDQVSFRLYWSATISSLCLPCFCLSVKIICPVAAGSAFLCALFSLFSFSLFLLLLLLSHH